MEGQTDRLPAFYADRIRQDLGPLHDHLPAGSLMHDPNAYLKSSGQRADVIPLEGGRRRPRAAPDDRLESANTQN
jgi:hypothetical protein